MKTNRRPVCAPLLVVILSIFYAGGLAAQEKSAPDKVRIAVATSSLAFLVPFVAKDRGLYLKHGNEVEIIQMRPNVAMAALISAGCRSMASTFSCKSKRIRS